MSSITAQSLQKLISDIYAVNGRSGHYDPALAAAAQRAQVALAAVSRSYSHGVNEANIDYADAARTLKTQKAENSSNTAGQFAGSGLLHSGIYAMQEGKIATAYQKSITDAAARRQAAAANANEAALGGYRNIHGDLTTAQASAATRAAERARQEALARQQAAHEKEMLRLQQAQIDAQKKAAADQLAFYQGSVGATGRTP